MAGIPISGDMAITVCAYAPNTAEQERQLFGECVGSLAIGSPVVTVAIRRDKDGRVVGLKCQNKNGVVGEINFCKEKP